MAFTFYSCFLRLYPESYRDEFAEEMTSVFYDARSALPPALPSKVSFYGREVCGLVSGALWAHIHRLFGPAIRFRRCDMQPQFRFPRSTVFLMLVIFLGVVLAIHMAAMIAGDKSGTAWQASVAFWSSVLAFMLLTTCTAAAVVLGVLHTLRRSGVHRLEKLREANKE